MKLTNLTLENYRSFQGKHSIDFAPITLLFGANSAGKSTIIKAIKNFNNLSLDDAFYGKNKASLSLGFARNPNAKPSFDSYSQLFFNFYANKSVAQEKNRIEVFYSTLGLIKNKVHNFAVEKTISKEDVAYSKKYLAENPDITDKSFIQTLFTTKLYLNSEVFLTYHYCDEYVNDDYNALFSLEKSTINKNHSIFEDFKLSKLLDFFADSLQGLTGQSLPMATHSIKSLIEEKKLKDDKEIYNIFDLFKKAYFTSEDNQEDCLCLLLGIFSGLKSIYLRVNKFALEFNHLGPLRKVPNSDEKIKGHLSPHITYVDDIGLDYYSATASYNEASYSGQDAWDFLSSHSNALKQANNWLADWFHTPYEISFQSIYTLILNTLEKQQALEQEKINLSNFDALDLQVRIKNLFNGSITGAEDIGTGISQLTPVIAGVLASQSFGVEQPELHIHPKMQTILGDLFIFTGLFEAVEEDKKDDENVQAISIKDLYGEEKTYYFRKKADADKSFILAETHSEHLLLRLLKRIREGILNPQDLAINYIASQQGKSQVTPIGVNQDGDFTNQWPDGFFEERLDELF